MVTSGMITLSHLKFDRLFPHIIYFFQNISKKRGDTYSIPITLADARSVKRISCAHNHGARNKVDRKQLVPNNCALHLNNEVKLFIKSL